MIKIKLSLNKISTKQKIICLSLLISLILISAIALPSLAKYKNRSAILSAQVWDGTIANKYHSGSGTENDPYIISSGSELAYFSSQLSENNYENTYFEMSNDIILNKGSYGYSIDNEITYFINGQNYYINKYANKYYETNTYEKESGTLNTLEPLNNFKGIFDGKDYTIYGLYLTNSQNEQLALFTNLEGNITNFSLKNAFIYGGNITAGIASKAINSTISSVLFEGYVIGKSENINTTIDLNLETQEINIQNTETTISLSLNNSLPLLGGEIISTNLTGNSNLSTNNYNNTTIKVNNNDIISDNFTINLGSNILDNITVKTITTEEVLSTVTLSNLKYQINYNYAASGGIVAEIANSTINNTISKGYVYGYSKSGGLVGTATNGLTINNSYNTANVISNYNSGGIIGTIEKSNQNISIDKTYNRGELSSLSSGGLIGNINKNTGNVFINRSFNANSSYTINTITNTNVNITNSYHISELSAINNGTATGTFTKTTIENLKNKIFLISNLSLNEFINKTNYETNRENTWIYENNSLPILINDDINNPLARINTNVYSWNNFSEDLNTVKLTNQVTLNIEPTSEINNLKAIYYYINNSTKPLSTFELNLITSWHSNQSIVTLNKEGNYIIYAKLVDNTNQITYINTDILNIKFNRITLNNNDWNNYKNELEYVYIDKPQNATIHLSENANQSSEIKYYISDEILTTNDLNSLANTNWNTYNNQITIDEIGTHIIYAKINYGENITYLNTDYIVLNGYNQTYSIGRGNNYPNSTSITNKSIITLNSTYSSNLEELTNCTHNLISNVLLPQGTKLTLIDNITNKVYVYQIETSNDLYNYQNSCNANDQTCIKKATYPFTLFKEIGTSNNINKYYYEQSYYNAGTTNENFDVIIDLKNTNFNENYENVNVYLELHNSENITVRPTLYLSIDNFNIYSTVNNNDSTAERYLNTNYQGTIIYNSNSTTNIDLNTGISYKSYNNQNIIDTKYEDKEIGLAIKLIDSNGEIVNKEQLKSITFKIDNKRYYPQNDSIIRINLSNALVNKTKRLIITTLENNNTLKDGEYYLEIYSYSSLNGNCVKSITTPKIIIPVIVTSTKTNTNYQFDVLMDPGDRIINKSNSTVNINFNIIQKGQFTNPNIKVSLHKKNQLTAYNQNYSLINLANYVENNLIEYQNNIYTMINNPITYNGSSDTINSITLKLITTNLEKTGYKFLFELYDGNKKVGNISKNIIIK